jgi:hypothetical protein
MSEKNCTTSPLVVPDLIDLHTGKSWPITQMNTVRAKIDVQYSDQILNLKNIRHRVFHIKGQWMDGHVNDSMKIDKYIKMRTINSGDWFFEFTFVEASNFAVIEAVANAEAKKKKPLPKV